MHPKDLVPVLTRQMMEPDMGVPKVINLGGGIENCMSLKELSNWCEERFGSNEIIPSEEVRPMDAPWIVMDSKVAQNAWNWNIQTKLDKILDEIADYAEKNPSWLKMCN
jgi:CDP-paratose 2-epimerase